MGEEPTAQSAESESGIASHFPPGVGKEGDEADQSGNYSQAGGLQVKWSPSVYVWVALASLAAATVTAYVIKAGL